MAMQQGDHDFLDGNADEFRGVIRKIDRDAGREKFGKRADFVAHRVRRFQRIRRGREFDADRRRGFAVDANLDGIILAAKFNPRHVAQQHARAVRIDAQQNFAEFLRR